jgi:hypothetical protein
MFICVIGVDLGEPPPLYQPRLNNPKGKATTLRNLDQLTTMDTALKWRL